VLLHDILGYIQYADTIANAADQRMAHIRSFQTSNDAACHLHLWGNKIMAKAMGVAVLLLLLFIAIGGLVPGVLLFAAFSLPIGIVLGIVAVALGWFK